MLNKTTITALLVVFYIAALAVYWLRLGGEAYELVRNVMYVLSAGIGLLGGIFAVSHFGVTGNRARTILFLTAGVACWFIGEFLWNYYELVLHIDPFPSLADAFYLIGYPLLLAGFINEIRSAQIQWKKLHPATTFLLVLVSLLFIGAVGYFGIYLPFDAQEPLLSNVIAIGYGVGDMLLIIINLLVLVLAWEFRGGSLSKIWLVFFLSFIFTLIADILFALFTKEYEQQVWVYKSAFDSLWMLAYVFLAYALFSFGFSIQDIRLKFKKKS